jgi:hypothetical protein
MADLVHGALIEADSGHTALTECGVITSCLVPSPRTPSLTPIPYALPSPSQIMPILHMEFYFSQVRPNQLRSPGSSLQVHAVAMASVANEILFSVGSSDCNDISLQLKSSFLRFSRLQIWHRRSGITDGSNVPIADGRRLQPRKEVEL